VHDLILTAALLGIVTRQDIIEPLVALGCEAGNKPHLFGFLQGGAGISVFERNLHGLPSVAIPRVDEGPARSLVANQHPLLAESVFKIADELSRGIDGRGFSTFKGVEIVDLHTRAPLWFFEIMA
jgi:hypothetical protein